MPRSPVWSVFGVAAGLVFMAVPAEASDAKYHKCEIQYGVKMKADPEHRIKAGTRHKQFSACVKSLADCKHRAPALARAREDVYRGDSTRDIPDLGSISIASVRTDGHCSKLD